MATLTGGITGQYQFTDVSFAAGTGMQFTTGNDTTTGNAYVQVFCFAAGTRIATVDGDVAVENLQIGSRLPTLIGKNDEKIVWIGKRLVDCARHPRTKEVWPVRIAPATFGPSMPQRPLLLSPDHAIYIDGALIPVKHLIDDVRIVQVPVDEVTYYHIELARHDVVLAEGLPTETYLDVGDRHRFEGEEKITTLFPDFASTLREGHSCAPIIVDGAALTTARALISRPPFGVLASVLIPAA